MANKQGTMQQTFKKSTIKEYLVLDKELAQPQSVKQDDATPRFEFNHCYLTLYVLTLALNNICVSWTTGGNNQTANVIAAKLDWTGEQTRNYNAAINFAS